MKKSLIIFAAAALALIGCAKQAPVPAAKPGDVQFTTNIRTYSLKATDIAFTNGDEVGIFAGAPINKNNVKATVEGSALNHKSAIKWVDDDNSIVKFTAYYPYAQDAVIDYPFAVQADQGVQGNYEKSDLMLASASSDPTVDAVALNFSHALSKVSIGINNQIDATISKVVFEDVALSATVNLETGAISSPGAKGNITARTIPGGFELIVVPQNAKPSIRVSMSNGMDYVFELAADSFTFKPGTKASASLVLKEGNPVTFTLDVTNWTADTDALEFGDPTEEVIPVVEQHWGVVGLGDQWDWDHAVLMTQTEAGTEPYEGVWEADITYAQGDEFKLAWNDWEREAGMNPDWSFYLVGDFDADSYLWGGEASVNIVLGTGTDDETHEVIYPESGDYHVVFIYNGHKLIVTPKE